LLDSGVAIINESCGVQSVQITDPYAWVFRVATAETTFIKESITTQPLVSNTTGRIATTEATSIKESITTQPFVSETTEQSSSTRQITTPPRPTCPQWFQFNRISNESTSANEPYFTFCFTVETTLADVTISANTWVPCMIWKLSGTADPLLELYTEPHGKLLAENDDGNNLTFQNCYAAVLSYRLEKGDYRVIIRNPKCAYGKFELRLSAEIDRNLK
jgi:hypothetical protein